MDVIPLLLDWVVITPRLRVRVVIIPRLRVRVVIIPRLRVRVVIPKVTSCQFYILSFGHRGI